MILESKKIVSSAIKMISVFVASMCKQKGNQEVVQMEADLYIDKDNNQKHLDN